MRYFYYDGDRIIAEREGNAWVVRYLLGLRPSGFMANGQVRVYHADRLGSVRWVTDGSQNILVSYVYEGFGKIVGQNGGGGGPYQFCGLWGYRNDQDAGLMHVGARYYEFETGRWVQKDPLVGNYVRPQTLNRFTYCENNSANKIDPYGLVTLIPLILIVGFALAVTLLLSVAFERIRERRREDEEMARCQCTRVNDPDCPVHGQQPQQRDQSQNVPVQQRAYPYYYYEYHEIG